jgi:hypothetical protein
MVTNPPVMWNLNFVEQPDYKTVQEEAYAQTYPVKLWLFRRKQYMHTVQKILSNLLGTTKSTALVGHRIES